VLLVLFTALDSSGTFPGLLNLANLLQQGAGRTIIAMGLVFVLLTGRSTWRPARRPGSPPR
jgi:D-xylose transport system permease protein